jgi:hypothetical protein
MKSSRLLDRRFGYTLASLGMLLGVVAPAAIPAFASADVLSSRSISMTSATAGATGVDYDIKFTAPGSIAANGGIAIDFCTNSPLVGSACTHPTMTTNGATVSSVKFGGTSKSTGTLTATTNGSVSWATTDAYTGGTTFELVLSGVTNPAPAGTFYSRITTYANATDLGGYATGATPTVGSYADSGAVAMSATENVGVTAYVLESMTFCVSKGDVGDTSNASAVSTTAAPAANCGSVVAPSMTIGQASGAVTALSSSAISTGSVYAQLSTNANGGAIVNLKSDATSCGGLYLNGVADAAHCNIAPQTTAASSFTAGTPKFGIKVGSSTTASGGTANGTLAAAGSYDSSNFYIDAASDNSTGVTSTYGSPLLTTGGTQSSDLNIPITFGASISPSTPAGKYGANLSMIATGTF